MNQSHGQVQKAKMDTNALAVILYSGGTTGKPKGIFLFQAQDEKNDQILRHERISGTGGRDPV